MVNLRNIHSLSDLQRNTKQYISQLSESHEPVVLTVNGKAALIVQDAESYQELLDELELARSVKSVKQGMDEFAQGKDVDAKTGLEQLRAKHEISS